MHSDYLTPRCIQSLAALPLYLLFRLCIKMEVRGIEHIQGLRSPFILASNHVHELDPLLLVASLPHFSQLPLIFVSRTKEFYKPIGWRSIFYGGTLFRSIGALPAYPGLHNYDLALPHHIHAIAAGQSVCIFPLGKRHTDSDVSAARGGVTYLAYKTGVPIVPVRITGITHLTVGNFFRRRCNAQVTFGKPLAFTDLTTPEGGVPSHTEKNHFEQAATTLMKTIVTLHSDRD